MKTQNTHLFQPVSPEVLNQLTAEVKETVAADLILPVKKTAFGPADLWNLERSRRIRIIRRHLV
jgi:hypothetical protein